MAPEGSLRQSLITFLGREQLVYGWERAAIWALLAICMGVRFVEPHVDVPLATWWPW